ncbi:MarR family transcriptional regulator [Terrisporobacter vanillatitrophus]|uniref:MarR family transcriptional regulator n=1 Tax=Terrisporobacter vanillatitrophus TaxID=3058402 RepID=UPI003365E2C7
MNNLLLDQIAEFLEKQDLLAKLTENEKLHEYGTSEIHTIEAIGDLENPNVTEIAKHLKMTKGAISKITKRLIKEEAIEPYSIPSNKQKVFFKLTVKGQFLYEEHDKRHKLWLERDNKFLSQFDSNKLKEISNFIISFNEYMQEQIEELSENKNKGEL